MADQLQRLIAQLGGTGMVGEGSYGWNSGNPEARPLIRDSIAQTLKIDDPRIVDLSEPPRPEKWSVSISHTHAFGGWVAVPRTARVGFDVEMTERIKPVTVARVSTPFEIDEAPDSRLLWCAKECVYKALEHEQPDAVTRLHIKNWKRDEEYWHFECHGYPGLQGVILHADELIFGLCTIP